MTGLPVVVAALFLIGAVGIALVFLLTDSSDPSMQADAASSAVDAGAAGAQDTEEATGTGSSGTAAGGATDVDDGTGGDDGDDQLTSPAQPTLTTEATFPTLTDVNTLQATVSGSDVVLVGSVPDAEVEAAVLTLLSEMLGTDQIASELVLDPAVEPPRSMTVQLVASVLFQPGSAEIEPELAPLLDRVAALMARDQAMTLVIEGHTDAQGNPVDNLALSQRRAESARTYLIEQGVSGFRVEAEGRGDTEPVADNDTLAGRQGNRRIELQLVGFQLAAGS